MTRNIDTDTAYLQTTKKHKTHRPRTSLILQLKDSNNTQFGQNSLGSDQIYHVSPGFHID